MNYLNDIFGLNNKTVVITGGAGAIGLSMSDALLRAGANLMIWSRKKESIDKAFDKIPKKYHHKCMGIAVDTSSEQNVRIALSKTIQHFKKVDILINAVGGNSGKSSFINLDINKFNEILKNNLLSGLVIPTKIFAKYWILSQIKGSIINITSVASTKPLSGVWAYNAAKSAVLNLTHATANEFAKNNIRVNAITPGFFIGKQNKDLLLKKGSKELTKRGKSIIQNTPLKRFGKVHELHGATLFLSSDKASSFVTGISIPVDGGFLINNI